MWWIIGIVVIGIIVFNINNDHKEHVKTNIADYGGMKRKYEMIICYLESSGLSIKRTTIDSIVLSSNSSVWTLDYVGHNLEVRMKGYMPLLGNINKKWIFPDSYPQKQMIEEIENYFNSQLESLAKAAENDPYKYLNDK